MRHLGASIAIALLGLLAAPPALAQVLFSEIRIDDANSPTNVDPNEYFELRLDPSLPSGSPLPSLADLTYVVIGRRPIQLVGGVPYGGAGVIVGIIKFPAGTTMPPTGRYLGREPTMQLPPNQTAQLTTSLPFEDDATQTHLLVRGFNFAMFGPGYSPVGFDLDIDNDGTLDITPWSEVVDSVSFLKTATSDTENRAYSSVRLGPASDGIPAHIFRCQNISSSWRVGRRAFQLRNIQAINRAGPTQSPFTPLNPYNATLNGVLEAGSVVRVAVSVVADTSSPASSFDVFIGGTNVGTLSGFPSCGTSPARNIAVPINFFNQVLIDNGNSVPISVVPNGSVGAGCPTSNCQVSLIYEAPDPFTVDTPGATNLQCGAGCDTPNPFSAPPCCVGDLNGDGAITAGDLAFYNSLNGFSYRDVNNDGAPGTSADRDLVIAFGPCSATAACGLNPKSCLIPHAGGGCSYAPCCEAVCADPLFAYCCQVEWDDNCVSAAFALPACAPCGPVSFDQSCYFPGAAAGCNDPACCSLICLDPRFEHCCLVQWDASCADRAREVCLFCGSDATISCFLPNALPNCADPWCCERVCAIPSLAHCCEVSWDAGCVKSARALCGKCGEANLQPCSEPSFGPGCRNAECCQKVCNIDPACCSVAWDQQCVERANQLCLECGVPLAGSCCIPHASPFCDDTDCCRTVCDQYDPFCCSTSWDSLCVTLAAFVCNSIDCPCGSNPASCFTAHTTPGCNEKLCCYSVCSYDDFCCLVRWDTLCAAHAAARCSSNGACIPGAGSCTVPHSTPGCDSPASCCGLVCAIAPECCVVAWDELCVATAFQVCLNCGDPASGSCYTASGSPGCADPICCNSVCNADPFCCVIGWDGACVSLAFALCGDPIASCSSAPNAPNRNCFMASRGRGCNPAACCVRVCDQDVFCCTVEWDAICALEASLFCPLASSTNSVGSCFAEKCCSPGPGCLPAASCRACADRGCGSAVCAYRPSCCSTVWDAECVDLAYAVCIHKEPCPTDNSCLTSNRGPGCKDPSCCNAVCQFDPHCCDYRWDGPCVLAARDLCVSQQPWKCPCDGSCFSAKVSPGCEDASCCAAVCHVDPNCCIYQWDTNCAQIARSVCCGLGLCGDACNKSCLEVHAQPYCNNSWCCEAVCAVDPFCCSSKWDTFCVQQAFLRCAGTCGQPTSGNCFAEHQSPGCRITQCCADICAIDPACCAEEWDSTCAEMARTMPICTNRRPRCGESIAGKCCVAHTGPACDQGPCCAAVCAQDPSCCEEEWDDLCVTLAKQVAACTAVCNPPCGADCAGSCCEVHGNPRCSNLICCEAVCFGWTDERGVVYGGDSFCCNIEWDANCVDRALQYSQILGKGGQVIDGPCATACPLPSCGSVLAGDCCTPHPGPFCVEAGCCLTICAQDSYCCEVSWDANCATAAFSLCNSCVQPTGCGTPGSGSCLSPHFTPYCSDGKCCEIVCIADPTCCSVQWDFDCVELAFTLCFFGPTPPVNDECDGALSFGDVSAAGLNIRPFLTTGATQSLSPTPSINCGGAAIVMTADTWWTLEFPQDGLWEISTCNLANFDTAIAVYEGDCANPFLRACNDNAPFCAQFTSTVTWQAVANQPYLVRIGSPNDGSGQGYVMIRFLGP